jgi:MscS family membrane protein
VNFERIEDLWEWLGQTEFLGLGLDQITAAILVILLSLTLRRFTARFLLGRLRAMLARVHPHTAEKLAALEKPFAFIPLAIGLILATRFLQPGASPEVVVAIDRIDRSLVVFAVFWGLFAAIKPLMAGLGRISPLFNATSVEWLGTVARILVVLVGGATVLEVWGIRVGPVLAGLGLVGAAVALGAQELFKNLIAGLFVVGEQRFGVGDWVLIDGIGEGVIESIGLRSTVIRRFDQAPLFVPNSKLADGVVTNFSKMPNRRIHWTIGLTYSTTIEQQAKIRDEIEAWLRANDGIVQPPSAPLMVAIDSFQDSAIAILVNCFSKGPDYATFMRRKEELAYAVQQIVERNGGAFAFPSQSIYIETGPVPGSAPVAPKPEPPKDERP